MSQLRLSFVKIRPIHEYLAPKEGSEKIQRMNFISPIIIHFGKISDSKLERNLRILNRIYKNGNFDVMIPYYIGNILHAQRKIVDAVKWYEECLAFEGDTPYWIKATAFEMLYRLGTQIDNFEMRFSVIRRYFAMFPLDSVAHILAAQEIAEYARKQLDSTETLRQMQATKILLSKAMKLENASKFQTYDISNWAERMLGWLNDKIEPISSV